MWALTQAQSLAESNAGKFTYRVDSAEHCGILPELFGLESQDPSKTPSVFLLLDGETGRFSGLVELSSGFPAHTLSECY